MGEHDNGSEQGEPNEEDNMVDEDVVEEEALVAIPSNKTHKRLKTPERSKPVKRSRGFHDEEANTKRIMLDDDEMEEEANNDGIDVDSIKAKKKGQDILFHAIPGHGLTELYSNERLELASDRHIISHLASVDISEISSPERIASV